MKKIYFCLVKPSMAIALLAILTRILNLQCRSNDGTTHRSQTPSCFCLNKKSDAAIETSTSEVCYYLYCRHRMTGARALLSFTRKAYFLLIHDWMTYDFYPRHAWAQWLLSTSDGLRKACSPAQLTINLLSMSFRLIQLVCVTKKMAFRHVTSSLEAPCMHDASKNRPDPLSGLMYLITLWLLSFII